MIRLAINGFGRIGRCILRALYESGNREQMQVVAINEPADLSTIVHLTKYDSTHGRFPAVVEAANNGIMVNGDFVALTHHEALSDLNWADHDVDIVLECSGSYSTPAELEQHIAAGADKALLSQPGVAPLKAVVFGINHTALAASEKIASAASCTSNCITPVIDVLHKAFSIETGTITTIHSAMNDQPIIDAYHHTDLRKTRAAGQSIIPVDTSLAAGIDRILPALAGKFTARALRVPTQNVSVMELTANVAHRPDAESVNAVLKAATNHELSGILGYSREPLASCDYNHDTHSGIVDCGQTKVSKNLLSVLIWFDNEWAYANRMLDVAKYWCCQ